MAKGLTTCRICRKESKPGSAVVMAFGAGGRIHKKCLPAGRYMLANGEEYSHTIGKTNAAPASFLTRETTSQGRFSEGSI